jgi:hypothetical protein
MARPRDGDRRDFVVLYGGGVRKTLTGALTLTNRQPGGRSGDRAAGLRPLIPRVGKRERYAFWKLPLT